MDDRSAVESFKTREIEILQLLAQGCSNQDICNRLFMSMNTVRWYLRQLYDKLGIEDAVTQGEKRRLAVSRARQMGLLGYESSPIKHNLRTQTMPFIGRERELSDLSNLLSNPDVRLVTVVASGGMGKTRLALEIAQHALVPPLRPSPSPWGGV